MAMVLLPPFFLPSCTMDWSSVCIGRASKAMLCLKIVARLQRALSGSFLISLKLMLSSPIAALVGKEEQACLMDFGLRSIWLAHSVGSFAVVVPKFLDGVDFEFESNNVVRWLCLLTNSQLRRRSACQILDGVRSYNHNLALTKFWRDRTQSCRTSVHLVGKRQSPFFI